MTFSPGSGPGACEMTGGCVLLLRKLEEKGKENFFWVCAGGIDLN